MFKIVMFCLIMSSMIYIQGADVPPPRCNDGCNMRCLVYHTAGLTVGVVAYKIAEAITTNLTTQLIAGLCVGIIPTLAGSIFEVYKDCKKKPLQPNA